MWWQWLIFGLIILAVPYGLYEIKKFAAKRIKPTEEQNKIANQRFAILCLFYWLCDCFYMTFIINDTTWKFILGGLIMVIIFYNLSKAFINGNSPLKFGLVQDFIVGIALTIYLIYIIPNESLQQIIIPIVAAVYGGLLTLVGVAWTIRKSDKDRKLEEKNKVKPYLKNYLKSYRLDQDVKIEFIDINKQDDFKCQSFVLYLHNISKSIIFVTDIIIHNTYYSLKNVVLEKDGKIKLKINYYDKEIQILKNITIVGRDVLDNYYAFDMHSENLCEEFEDTRIELPRELEYFKGEKHE